MPSKALAGYSGTPLAKKLGIAEGARVRVIDAPRDYGRIVDPLPDRVTIARRVDESTDLVHVFATSKAALAKALASTMKSMRRDAVVWASWPKKASGVPTDITEDVVREVALPMGLVDVKVCAVDETWSGLKLVIRKSLR
jgi:hypothetical protein